MNADTLLALVMPLEADGRDPAPGARPRGDAGRLPAPPVLDRWRDGDIARAADLLRLAYPPPLGALFTTNGTAAEWRTYLTVLVKLAPCGRFQPEWSRVIRDGDALLGIALMTCVAPGTAHLAQLAVHPDVQRRGLAMRLVRDTAAAAHAAGCRELTLLVARGNAPAQRLYASIGFTAQAA